MMRNFIIVITPTIKKFFLHYLVLPILFLLNQECHGQYAASAYPIHLKGHVKIVNTYKGGAEPDKQLLDELNKPVPMSNRKLFLKKTYYAKEYYIIQTDSAGNFDLNIKPGLYNIYLLNEKEPADKMTDSSDERKKCEESFKTQSYGKLKVFKKGNSPVEITVSEKINPCSPLPPAVDPNLK